MGRPVLRDYRFSPAAGDRGVTLIEVIVVIAVLGVISGGGYLSNARVSVRRSLHLG